MGGAWPTRALVSCCALLAFAAAPTHASTDIGAVAPSDPENCAPGAQFMQQTVAVGGPSYDVPSDGVITSWSTLPATTGTHGELKVYRSTSDPLTWTVVGQSAEKRLTAGAVSTAATRVAVKAGDRIGVRDGDNGGPCLFPATTDLDPGYGLFDFGSLSGDDPGLGTPVTFFDDSAAHKQVNIAAVLEPDVDGDGFGDETQDLCPGSAGPTMGCVPPSPPGPPAPGPAAPVLTITTAAKHTQRVLKQRGIVLSVQPNVACTVSATATVSVPGARTVLRFKRARKNAAAGGKVTLKLKLTKAQLRRVKKALARHRKLYARPVVTSTAGGAAAKVTRLKRIRLKP
jgi:hypothetical protein